MSDSKNKPAESQEKEYDGADCEEKEEKKSGILEKIFTALSLVLLAGLSAFLIWQSFAPSEPPSFKVELGPSEKRGDYQGVEVTINNIGDDAAKGVQVRGETPGADGKPVEAEATLDWLPGDSKRKVTLIFPADAKTSDVEVQIAGYEEP